MNFLIRVLIIAAVSFGLAYVLKGVNIDTFWTAIIFALVLAVLNIFLKPLPVV